MIIFGVVLVILGLLTGASVLSFVGALLVIVGAILWILGAVGHQIGRRPHYY